MKTIWITGASLGIGRATVLEALKRGCQVAASARGIEALEQLQTSAGLPDRLMIAPCDVTDHTQVEKAHRAICERFGGVDILIANAGTHTPQQPGQIDIEVFRRLFEINLFGTLNCIAAVVPDMQRRGSGHVVGVSSVAGYRALPTAAAYGGSKAALSHILESLRFDLQPQGITVTVVSPGFVRTPLTAKNEFNMPFIIEADEAARRIMDGVERKAFEIHFPKRFTYILKILRVLPARLYYQLMKRATAK